jgi:hypothetical protein
MTARSGLRCSELSAKLGPVGSWERTLLALSTWRSMECYLTWKITATPAGRLLFRLAPSMPRIEEIESGLWPTATVGDSKSARNSTANRIGPTSAHAGDTLTDMATKLWPTPNVAGGGNRCELTPHKGHYLRPSGHKAHLGLDQVARMLWPTPVAKDDGKSPEAHLAMKARMKGGPRNTITSLTVLSKDIGGPPAQSKGGGSLNPAFVCWLMGYPEGWLD